MHPPTLSLCILEIFVVCHPSARLSANYQSRIAVHQTRTSFFSDPFDYTSKMSHLALLPSNSMVKFYDNDTALDTDTLSH